LRSAIAERRNILVSGGTGSGKTTLVNAILDEMVRLGEPSERFILLEDTVELQCTAENHTALRTTRHVDLATLVKATMRLNPDRIIIGEVRGREALDLLKAWNTGHPGGCTTVHANNAVAALHRLDQLAQEAGVPSQRALIADTVGLVVHIEGGSRGRRVSELVRVAGLAGDGSFRLEPSAAGPNQEE
ncbi:MAG TPA: ATPase, T2SS/T4P/T4SS family, partial [Thermoanaerobaculia bacterium]|nr:ATPase, T2SS/T4P/T4SS family [Thermoanaerobaculia bacterium]